MNGKVSGDYATSRFPFNESTQHSDGEGSSEGIVWLWWPSASRLSAFASPSQSQMVVHGSIIGRLIKANPTNGTQKCEHFWRLFWTLEHNEVPHCAEASNESFQIHQAHYTLIDLFVNGEGTLHQLHKRRKMKVFDAPSLRKTLQQQQQKRQTPYKKS